MFCPNCGSNLPDNAQFCANCGTQLAYQQPYQAQQTYQPYQAQQTYQPYQAQQPAGKKLTKKQIITIVCVAVAVAVAIFLIFFFACGGCDSSAQTSIVNNYIDAVEKGDAKTVAKLYYPGVIDDYGYGRDEYEEFVEDCDGYYDEFAGEKIKKHDVTIKSIKEIIEPMAELYGAYGYDVDDLMDEAYEAFEDEYGAKLSDIGIAVVNAEFKNGDDVSCTIILVKVDGKWYIAGVEEGSIGDYLY